MVIWRKRSLNLYSTNNKTRTTKLQAIPWCQATEPQIRATMFAKIPCLLQALWPSSAGLRGCLLGRQCNDWLVSFDASGRYGSAVAKRPKWRNSGKEGVSARLVMRLELIRTTRASYENNNDVSSSFDDARCCLLLSCSHFHAKPTRVDGAGCRKVISRSR